MAAVAAVVLRGRVAVVAVVDRAGASEGMVGARMLV